MLSKLFGGKSAGGGMPFTSDKALAADVKALAAVPVVTKKIKDKMQRDWATRYKANNEGFLREVHATHLRMLAGFDGKDRALGTLILNYQKVFSDSKYTGYNVSHLYEIFGEMSPRVVAQIDRLLQFDPIVFAESDRRRDMNDTGQIIENIFNLYFYHLTYPKLEYRLDPLHLILPYYTKYQDRYSNLVISLFEEDKSSIEPMAALVDLSIEKLPPDTEMSAGAFILHDMMSTYAKREDFTHKHSPKILKKVLEARVEWSDAQVTYLVDQLFLGPLDYERDIDAASEAEKIAAKIKVFKKYPDLKAEHEAKAALIENDFAAYRADQLGAAATQIRKSKVRRKCADMVISKFGDHAALEPLREIMVAVEGGVAKAKVYDTKQKPSVEFADYAFKLMVIEELMYRRGDLTPKFDIHAFAKEYEARDISVEDDGYAIIPEAEAYYKNLNIPQALLDNVTELTLDDGCGGGMKVVYHYYPFWDPGCGDEVMMPGAGMAQDLGHLPNLKKITFIGTEPPDSAIKSALSEAGIEYVFDAY